MRTRRKKKLRLKRLTPSPKNQSRNLKVHNTLPGEGGLFLSASPSAISKGELAK